MIKNIKMVLRGAVLLAGLTACAGCNGGGSKSGDIPVTDTLSFTWTAKDVREVQSLMSLTNCAGDSGPCYSVVDLNLVDQTGSGTKGELSEEQLAALEALVTPEMLAKYEADKDADCETEGQLRYALSYEDHQGTNHFYCLDPDDDLSAETQEAIETMTEMAELLLKTGEPQTR